MFVFVDIRLLRDIRDTMISTVQIADNLDNELARLQKELDDPLTERKQTSLVPADAGEKQSRQHHFPKPPKPKRGIR